MSNWSNPELVLETLRAGDDAEWQRAQNRLKVTNSANGVPPLDQAEAERLHQYINVEWGELATLLAHARRQYYNNFLKGTRFFQVSIPSAPEQIRAQMQADITNWIAEPMIRSKPYFHFHQYRWTDVVVHGVAAGLFINKEKWCPKFIARADLRIATDTHTDLENLEWFCYRAPYTPGELVKKAFTEPGWDKKMAASILKFYKNINYDSDASGYDWEHDSERLAELVKQNMGHYSSDAMPTIPIFNFYFKETDDKWYLRSVPDTVAMHGASDGGQTFLWPKDWKTFLYEDETPVADDLEQLLHCQLGDLSFQTPFTVHGVRSLGFELLDPTFYTNLARCRALQHLFENMTPWFQLTDPGDKARAQEIDMSGPNPKLPPGVSIVPQTQRHQIDSNYVEFMLSNLKQLMSEKSSSYTQQADTGTQKEQTAFETGVKVQQVNAMLSGLMITATKLETPMCREIARRFCIRNSSDKDVEEFQDKFRQAQYPAQFLNSKLWDIQVEAPLGSGNPTMELVQAQQLMSPQIFGNLNPTAKQEAFHDALCVMADPKRAARWAPMDGIKKPTDAIMQAQADFGSLMWGSDVPIKTELNAPEQIETLLTKMQEVIGKLQQVGGMASAESIIGLQTVAGHVSKLMQILEQNPNEKQRATAYAKALGKLMNFVKAFGQRLQQKMKSEQEESNNGNGQAESMANIQATMLKAKTDAGIKTRKAAQDMAHKNVKFANEQRLKTVGTVLDIQRKEEQAKAKNRLFEE